MAFGYSQQVKGRFEDNLSKKTAPLQLVQQLSQDWDGVAIADSH
jgi:hypothetical protein